MFRYHNQEVKLSLAHTVPQSVSFSKENTLVENLELWIETIGINSGIGDALAWSIQFNGIEVDSGTHPPGVPTEKLPTLIWNYSGIVPVNMMDISVVFTYTSGAPPPEPNLACKVKWLGLIGNPLS